MLYAIKAAMNYNIGQIDDRKKWCTSPGRADAGSRVGAANQLLSVPGSQPGLLPDTPTSRAV